MKNYSTAMFAGKNKAEIRDYVQNYFTNNFQGKLFVNKNKNIVISINKDSRRKTARPLMSKEKAIVVMDIDNVLKNCIYTNWGNPKPSHIKNFGAKGFLNFQYKCLVDGVIKSFRISIMIKKNVTFQYSLEHNDKN